MRSVLLRLPPDSTLHRRYRADRPRRPPRGEDPDSRHRPVRRPESQTNPPTSPSTVTTGPRLIDKLITKQQNAAARRRRHRADSDTCVVAPAGSDRADRDLIAIQTSNQVTTPDDAAATPPRRLHERREQGRPVRVGRPQRRVEGRPPLVPVLAFWGEIFHGSIRERRAPGLLLVQSVQALRGAGLRRRREGLAVQNVLPPPVLGALVAAPPQVHFITFTIGGVLLAVLAGAEPGPAWTEPSQ